MQSWLDTWRLKKKMKVIMFHMSFHQGRISMFFVWLQVEPNETNVYHTSSGVVAEKIDGQWSSRQGIAECVCWYIPFTIQDRWIRWIRDRSRRAVSLAKRLSTVEDNSVRDSAETFSCFCTNVVKRVLRGNSGIRSEVEGNRLSGGSECVYFQAAYVGEGYGALLDEEVKA